MAAGGRECPAAHIHCKQRPLVHRACDDVKFPGHTIWLAECYNLWSSCSQQCRSRPFPAAALPSACAHTQKHLLPALYAAVTSACAQTGCNYIEHGMQVDLAAAGRAAIQRRAPPTSEAAALPGGLPIFAVVLDEGNKVLQEAAPIGLLQVCPHSATRCCAVSPNSPCFCMLQFA